MLKTITRRAASIATVATSLVAASAAGAQISPAPIAAAATAQPAEASNKKICIKETQPGSRLPKKVCRTAEEWQLEQLSRQQKSFDPNQRF